MNKLITIKLKLFTGMDEDTSLQSYDYINGIDLEVKANTRIKTVLKQIRFKGKYTPAFFCKSERVSIYKKLKDGDTISCLKPAGGG